MQCPSLTHFFVLISFFFFFKQKTAYEMRISDWSSDVCSSDLPIFERPQRREAGWLPVLQRQIDPASRPHVDLGAAILVDEDLLRARQIGRASCRERVCQYV